MSPPFRWDKWNKEKKHAHVRVHRAGGYVENSVDRYVWQKEPCCQHCKGLGPGQQAHLDDAVYDVIIAMSDWCMLLWASRSMGERKAVRRGQWVCQLSGNDHD